MCNLSNVSFTSLSDQDIARLFRLNDDLLYFCGDDKLPALMAVYEELQCQIENEICERFCRSV